MPLDMGSEPALEGDQMPVIRRVVDALGTSASSSEALTELAAAARELTGSGSAAIGLLDESGTQIQFVAVDGRSATDVVGLKINVADSLAEEALRTGRPQVHGPGSDDPHSLQAILGFSGSVVVPIMRGGISIGAIFTTIREPGEAPGEDQVRALTMLADVVAVALERGEAARREKSQARELAVLYQAAQSIGTSLNVQDVLASVLEAVCGHLEHQAAALFLLNDERTHLFITADRGLTNEEREIQMAADAPALEPILIGGTAVVLSGDDADRVIPGFGQDRPARSAIVAPVCSRADAVGVMVIVSGQPDAYSDEDARLVSALAAQAGVAIQNAWLYEDATRRAEEAGAIYDLSQHVNSTLDLARVLEFVADSVPPLLNTHMFAIMLLDRRENRLVTRIYRGDWERDFVAVRPRLGEGIAGWVCQWGTPTAVADVPADARNHTARIDGAGVVSALCVPIAIGDGTIGVMMAMSSRRRLFTVAEMELLYTIANQAAAAISNAVRYREVRGRSAELQRYFGRIARALGASFDGGEALQLTADLVLALMRADRCNVYRIDGDCLAPVAMSGRRGGVSAEATVPMGEGLSGWIARRGTPVALSEIADDPRAASQTWPGRDRPASYLGVPIKQGRRTVGVMEVLSTEPRSYMEAEAALVARFVRQARVAEHLSVTQS